VVAKTQYVDMPQPLGLFAGDLYRRGKEYLDAFESLTHHQGDKLLFASYFLFAHSIELFLKAFLATKGVSKKDIRTLGHNLPKIMAKCVQHSMPHVAQLNEYVAHTFEMNKDFDFRYPSGYELSMPRPNECAPIAQALAAALEAIIAREHLRAQLHFASDTAKHRGKKIRWSD
jgi:hypothetical protein